MAQKAHKGRDGRWRVHARAFLQQVRGTARQVVTTETIYGDSKQEAETRAADWIGQQRTQFLNTKVVPRKPSKESLAVYGRRWLEARKPAGRADDSIRRSTWDGYDALFRTFIEAPKDPHLRLGNLPIGEVTAEQVEALYTYLRRTPNARGALTRGRAKALHGVLRQIFKQALKTGATKHLLREQLLGVFGRQKRRPRPEAYNEEQLTAFLKAADQDRYRAFWYLFAFTGMRPSELLALTVEDVDLETLTVHVSKRIRRLPERSRVSPDMRFEVDDPKTENSLHDVLLPEELVPIIRQHLAAKGKGASARAKAKRQWVGRYGKLLFTTHSGEPVDWCNLRMNYQRICRRAGLGTFGIVPEKARKSCRQHPKGCRGHGPGREATFKPLLKPYALRHTHATLSLADGVPIEVISERLGHYKTSFTLDTYVGKQTGRQMLVTAAWGKRAQRLKAGNERLP